MTQKVPLDITVPEITIVNIPIDLGAHELGHQVIDFWLTNAR